MSRAVAHPNIALAKYWGKRAYGSNLPAVPSLSITLDGMRTITSVELADGDTLQLDGALWEGRPLARVTALCDLIWQEAGRSGARPGVRVASDNDFPTAAGLASSASAFAALAVAADDALDARLGPSRLSCIARRVSASAGRSLFGGFVVLPAGEPGQQSLAAEPLRAADHWDLRLVVAVTAEGQKKIGSTEGMKHTAATSPLYDAWLSCAPAIFATIRDAVLARDLDRLGPAVEQSALVMHATAMGADPGLLYWNGVTLEVMHEVRRLRDAGTPAWLTIDAGPHVKVLTTSPEVASVEAALAAVDGVLRTISTAPGAGARLEPLGYSG
jgi:diphosphomevalonate decarboxylase